MTYSELDECINFISSRPKPLALYLFTEDKKSTEPGARLLFLRAAAVLTIP